MNNNETKIMFLCSSIQGLNNDIKVHSRLIGTSQKKEIYLNCILILGEKSVKKINIYKKFSKNKILYWEY